MAHPRKIVLHLEDDPDLRRAASRALREQGFLVASVAERDAAIELLLHVGFDVLVVGASAGGAIGAIIQARRLNPRIKVICATPAARIADRAYIELCDRRLAKPYQPDRLILEIVSALSA